MTDEKRPCSNNSHQHNQPLTGSTGRAGHVSARVKHRHKNVKASWSHPVIVMRLIMMLFVMVLIITLFMAMIYGSPADFDQVGGRYAPWKEKVGRAFFQLFEREGEKAGAVNAEIRIKQIQRFYVWCV